MDLIIDANILFSALIKEGATCELIFSHTLYAPEFLLEEFSKYKKYILKKTKRGETDFAELIQILKRNIIIISFKEIAPFIKQAEKICPDKNDTPYFALALKLNIPIWSNDKKLKNQKHIKIYTTEELLNIS